MRAIGCPRTMLGGGPSARKGTPVRNERSTAAVLEGSEVLRAGKADVFRIRERTRKKRVRRLIVVLVGLDVYLWYRYLTDNPIRMPSPGANLILFLPVILIFLAILLMMAMPLFSGRSPHIVVRPEEIEVGLTDVRGLDGQVDEVVRTLDVYLGKAMAKQAGVPFLFISAPAFQSMWFGMTGSRIRSFFKRLRKLARKEGGAIGFIEEIDAIGSDRGALSASPLPGLGRSTNRMIGPGGSGMVNELLIQMQSFDTPPFLQRLKGGLIEWINGFITPERRISVGKPRYNNILLIAATNRSDNLDAALLRPGRFDRRLYFDLPTKQGLDLIDFFLDRKAHHPQLDEDSSRERMAHDTFSYTPVMIEHLFDESLLVALRDGRRQMNVDDVYEAKLTEEIGIKQPVIYTDTERIAVATHEAGHASVAYFFGKGRRLEVLSIIKRRLSLGLLAHGDEEERFTRSRSEIEAHVAIALGGLVSE